MKKITSQKLSNRLLQYGALTIAIASVADASGQVVVYDVDPDEGGDGAFVLLDLGQDGVSDFAVGHFNALTSSSLYNYNILYALTTSGASILGQFNGSAYAFALDQGTVISNSVTSFNGIPAVWNSVSQGAQWMNEFSCYFPADSWCNVQDKFLGLKFTKPNTASPLDDTVHYGWARLDVNQDASSGWVLKDYAWEDTPDTPILAGAGLLGVENNYFSNIKIVALSKSIGLYNLPESSNYNVFNMTGQKVLNGTTNSRDYVIEAQSLASGVYIVELAETNSDGVIRKKVVLQ